MEINVYYLVMQLLIIVTMLIMSHITKLNRFLSGGIKQAFKFTFLMVALEASLETFDVIYNGYAGLSIITLHLFKSCELILAPFLAVYFANNSFALSNSHQKYEIVLNRLGISISIFNLLAVIANTLTHKMFYFDSNYLYHHGDFYWIYIFSWSSTLIYTFYRVYRYITYYQAESKEILTSIFIFMIFGLSVKFITKLNFDWFAIAILSMLLFFYYGYMDQRIDNLTRLLNQKCWNIAKDYIKKPVCLVIIDINDFKNINDTYGHDVGNIMLQEISKVIKDTFFPNGICYRIGGDEFAIVLEKDLEHIHKYCENLILNLTNARKTNHLLPTVSYGIATYNPKSGETIQEAIKKADIEMYNYKSRLKASKECNEVLEISDEQ